jgi:hypothetical protein
MKTRKNNGRKKKMKTRQNTKSPEFKYFYSLDYRCNLNKNSSMVSIYDKSATDSSIKNKTAKPVGVIAFTYKDLNDKCDLFSKADKLRLLTNNVVLNDRESFQFNVSYLLSRDRFQYSKDSLHKASIENATGRFTRYNRVQVKTKSNGIRIVKLT